MTSPSSRPRSPPPRGRGWAITRRSRRCVTCSRGRRSPLSDVPAATVVQDGKLGGDVPKPEGGAPRPRYKRKLSNYLLDKKLQLRYVMFVTILSGAIAGSLGYLIYQQRHTASASIESDLAA